jgi:hypothetical protein
MTIASHCLALILEHGPLSAEQLGAACREAGVTASRQPTNAASSALSQDGRAFLVRDRFHAVTALLEGRWLTFDNPVGDQAGGQTQVDLACLARVVEREGLPLAGGGTLTARPYSYGRWEWPDGSLPDGPTLGLRLVRGTAHVRSVVIDDDAKNRGDQLVELLTGADRHLGHDHYSRQVTAARRLLNLLADDDDLLREPVPPLSSLLPAPPEPLRQNSWQATPPLRPVVAIQLSPGLYDELDHIAGAIGLPLGFWLAEQLEWLADWPLPLSLGLARSGRSPYAGSGGCDAEDPWNE